MNNFRQQEIIDFGIDRLLNTRSAPEDFEQELYNFLSYLINADPELVRRTLTLKTEDAESQQKQISDELTSTETTRASLRTLKYNHRSGIKITKEMIVEMLQGEEKFQNIIDKDVLFDIILLKEEARRKKAVLQHRLWITDSVLENHFKRYKEIGDCVFEMLRWEAQVQCDCGNLFLIEQRNREMVLGLFCI